MDRYVLSLFSSAGIGELGIKASGLKILLSNELIESRCDLYRKNYPETECLCGDIWHLKDQIIQRWGGYDVGSPFLIYATPPCQGMSTAGKQKKDDPRNRLIIYVVQAIKTLNPKFVIIENVPEILLTKIEIDGKWIKIDEYLKNNLFFYHNFFYKTL